MLHDQMNGTLCLNHHDDISSILTSYWSSSGVYQTIWPKIIVSMSQLDHPALLLTAETSPGPKQVMEKWCIYDPWLGRLLILIALWLLQILMIHVYLEAGCAHLRPGAVRRMSPGRRSADEPWAQFDPWALGAILPMSPVIFATIGHSYYSRLVIIRGSFPWWPVWDCTQASYLQERCTALWYMLC